MTRGLVANRTPDRARRVRTRQRNGHGRYSRRDPRSRVIRPGARPTKVLVTIIVMANHGIQCVDHPMADNASPTE